jgi:hypothetical protein
MEIRNFFITFFPDFFVRQLSGNKLGGEKIVLIVESIKVAVVT